MAWNKPSEQVNALHAGIVEEYAGDKRKMFGMQVYFIHNNMFTGATEDGMILRLPPEEQKKIMAEKDEVVVFAPRGRKMKEYVQIPETLMNDPEFITKWVRVSYAYTSALAPKEKKKNKTKE